MYFICWKLIPKLSCTTFFLPYLCFIRSCAAHVAYNWSDPVCANWTWKPEYDDVNYSIRIQFSNQLGPRVRTNECVHSVGHNIPRQRSWSLRKKDKLKSAPLTHLSKLTKYIHSEQVLSLHCLFVSFQRPFYKANNFVVLDTHHAVSTAGVSLMYAKSQCS